MYGHVCLWLYHRMGGDKQMPEAHWLAILTASRNSKFSKISWLKKENSRDDTQCWPLASIHMCAHTHACTHIDIYTYHRRDQRQTPFSLWSCLARHQWCLRKMFWPSKWQVLLASCPHHIFSIMAVECPGSGWGSVCRNECCLQRPQKVSLPALDSGFAVHSGISISHNISSEFHSIQDNTGSYSDCVLCIYRKLCTCWVFCILMRNWNPYVLSK